MVAEARDLVFRAWEFAESLFDEEPFEGVDADVHSFCCVGERDFVVIGSEPREVLLAMSEKDGQRQTSKGVCVA